MPIPHPGNFLLMPGNVIGLLDFGNVGRIGDRLREELDDLLLAVVKRDSELLTSVIRRVGSTPPDLDLSLFDRDVSDFVSNLATLPIDRLKPERGAQRHGGARAPLPYQSAGRAGNADQGLGDSRGNLATLEPPTSA